MRSPLASLGIGLLAALVVGLLLVPARAIGNAILPIAVTVLVGGAVFVFVARRRPPDGEQMADLGPTRTPHDEEQQP